MPAFAWLASKHGAARRPKRPSELAPSARECSADRVERLDRIRLLDRSRFPRLRSTHDAPCPPSGSIRSKRARTLAAEGPDSLGEIQALPAELRRHFLERFTASPNTLHVPSNATREPPVSTTSAKIPLLFLGVSPPERELALTREFDELQTQLDPGRALPISHWVASAAKLPDYLDTYRPRLVHFSGHATSGGELVFVDEDGRSYAPDPDALARTFARHEGRVCCVVLNACFSAPLAARIADHVDVVIGTSCAITDADAHAFTEGFYGALARGRSVAAAFEHAKLKLELSPGREAEDFVLVPGSGPAPDELVLFPPLAAHAQAQLRISASARRYERTATFSTALAPRPDDRDQRPRARLLAALGQMDERARASVELQALDELWELVDLLGGGALALNPCEVFVLGSALLTHTLAASPLAYPGGQMQVRAQTRWQDLVAQLMRRAGLAHRPGAQPPEDIATRADALVLDGLHATRAAELPAQLIADPELRGAFAHLTGQLARSLWQPSAQLRDTFDERVGAPQWCPRAWALDPLRLACLLRAVRAAHELDERIASRMQQPLRQGKQLQFSASAPFAAHEAPCWWLAVESLRSIDAELRAVDAVLQTTGRTSLAVRRVAAVDDLRALQRHLPVQGWEPVDTRIRIGNIPALIERLGGRALYGRNTDAPLRELLQNAADAIRARRAYEPMRSANWGRIEVLEGVDAHGPWLEVRDDGLGMSKALLVGPLLDFGVSYWDSDMCCEEFPGLHASGFRSVGEFGIGFFSVFMWGPRVEVTTRSCRSARTSVLEFEQGLSTPPLLRDAGPEEHLVEGGTRVRIWLAQAEGSPRFQTSGTLAATCEQLCPTLDVDVYVRAPEDAEPRRVVEARDWLELSPLALMQRITGRVGDPDELLTGPPLSDDDFEIERVLNMMEPIVDPDTGEVHGRACLRPPWVKRGGNALVTRGLRLGGTLEPAPILGVLEGAPTRAARDEGRPLVRPDLLEAWYARQEAKVAATFDRFGQFEFAAALAPVMPKPVTKLPVLWGRRGWTLPELEARRDLPRAIILVFPKAFEDVKSMMLRQSPRARPIENLPPEVFMLCSPWVAELDHLAANTPTFMGLFTSLAKAWRASPDEIWSASHLTGRSGGESRPAVPNSRPWGSKIHILRHPHSAWPEVENALVSFDALVKQHPATAALAVERMTRLGEILGEVQKEQVEQRRKNKRRR